MSQKISSTYCSLFFEKSFYIVLVSFSDVTDVTLDSKISGSTEGALKQISLPGGKQGTPWVDSGQKLSRWVPSAALPFSILEALLQDL